jgi:hypothetical protein
MPLLAHRRPAAMPGEHAVAYQKLKSLSCLGVGLFAGLDPAQGWDRFLLEFPLRLTPRPR